MTDLDERLTLTSYRQLGIYYEVCGVVVLPVPHLRRPDLDVPLDRPHSALLVTQHTTKLPAAACTTLKLQLTESLQSSTCNLQLAIYNLQLTTHSNRKTYNLSHSTYKYTTHNLQLQLKT